MPLLFIFVGGGIILNIVNVEYIHRPMSILIKDERIVLSFRFGKSHFATWDEIRFIDSELGDSSILCRLKKGGQLGLKKTKENELNPSLRRHFILPVFQLTYETAEKIKEAYKKKIGRYPDTR